MLAARVTASGPNHHPSRTSLSSIVIQAATTPYPWPMGSGVGSSCALTAVRAFLVSGPGRKEPAVRQQWREFGSEATAKRGTARCAHRRRACLSAVGRGSWSSGRAPSWPWPSMRPPWHPLYGPGGSVVSAVVRSGGLTVLEATAQHAWRRDGCACCVRCPGRSHGRGRPRAGRSGACTRAGCVGVITRLDGTPFGHQYGRHLPSTGQRARVSLKTLVPEPGTTCKGTGMAFKGLHRQSHWTLLARWEAGYKDPC